MGCIIITVNIKSVYIFVQVKILLRRNVVQAFSLRNQVYAVYPAANGRQSYRLTGKYSGTSSC